MLEKKSKILIVGGAGYLGGHLIKHYLSDFQCSFTTTKKTELSNSYLVDYRDVNTFSSLRGLKFDCVLLCSSLVGGLDSVRLDGENLSVNTDQFKLFMQYLVDQEISSHLIYISSMTVYSEKNESPVNENAIKLPLHSYGLSKLLAEKVFEFCCERNKSVKGVVLRLPGIYGGLREKGFIYSVAEKCKKNEFIRINTSGLGFWEVMQINDLCKIIENFLKSYTWVYSYEDFNISYGEKIDFVETAFLIRKMVDSTSVIEQEGAKGYCDFFMSNVKIKSVVDIQSDFVSGLSEYLRELRPHK